MAMLDDWLASLGANAPIGATAGAPSAARPPSGMLASLFSPSGLTQPGGTLDSMLSGAVPTTINPGAFPVQPGASALASVPPGPPLDLAPPPAPQASAAPAQAPPGEPPVVPQTSLLGRLGSLFGDKAGGALGAVGAALDSRRNTLMALGAGLAGAPTLGMGLSRGLTNALPAAQIDRQQGFQNATLNWLKAKGMPEDAAKAVVANPQLLAQIAPQMFGTKQLTATTLGTDVLGHAIPGMMNPVTGEHYDIYGRKLTPGGPAGGPGGSLSGTDPARWAAMAPEERLSTMDPQVQGEIKAIYEGRQAATGRNVQQLLPLVNSVYPDFTMQDYNAKKVMRDDLNKSGNSSMGGILANGKSAFAHLADTSDRLAELGNASSNIPVIGGHLATAENWLGNVAGPTSDTKGRLAAANDALGHYGQESTKFYAGTGGGVEERQAAMRNANPATTSGAEQAAYLNQEKGLMLDRLHQKENQIRSALGDEYLQKNPVVTPELQGTIARIDANIAKLSGKAPAASGAVPAAASPAVKPPPAIGTIEQGHRFLGGDPANPASWATVQ